jgi:hypothetical protein
MPHLAYLAELKEVLTDPAVRKGYTLRILRLKGVKMSERYVGAIDLGNGTTHAEVATVFGMVESEYGIAKTLDELSWGEWKYGGEESNWSGWQKRFRRWENGWRVHYRIEWSVVPTPVCGIEVLGMRPSVGKTGFSNACLATVPVLKNACKENGIKGISKMTKVELLRALMKA